MTMEDPNVVLYVLMGALVVGIVAAVALIIRNVAGKGKDSLTQYTELETEDSETSMAPVLSESGWYLSAAQTIGARKRQEDALCYSNYTSSAAIEGKGLLAAVADGIGGMSSGQHASTTVVRSLLAGFREAVPGPGASQFLMRLVGNAHRALLEINRERERASRCGCTLVCLWIWEDALYFVSVGDSRLYLYRNGGLIQLNREHVLGTQIDEGLQQQSPEQNTPRRRKSLTAYMGKEDLQLVDRNTQPIPICPGDRLLLMSDGVFGTLSEAQMIRGLAGGIQGSADAIIRMVSAHRKTHQDNATVVVVGQEKQEGEAG